METISPASWTLENVPPLYPHLKGFAKYTEVVKMRQHCELCQDRKRLIMANQHLNIARYSGEQPTLHDVLGPVKGWPADAPLMQKDAWNGHKSTHCASFNVTGGAHYAGAKSMSTFHTGHLLDWKDKANQQGFPVTEGKPSRTLPVMFPNSTGEQFRKRAIANMVPPPFAKQLCLAALEGIKQRQLEEELARRVSLLMQLPNNDGVNECRQGETDIRLTNPTAKGSEGNSLGWVADLGTHGEWEFHPAYGWQPKGAQWDKVGEQLEQQPWLKISLPPTASETKKQWHLRRGETQRELERARGSTTRSARSRSSRRA